MSTTQIPVDMASKYTFDEAPLFMTGTQALVRLVMDARRNDRAQGLDTRCFISGYPGSPLGGLDKELQRNRGLLDELGVVHLPALNEELAATAVAGTQVVQGFRSALTEGVLGVWYGKSPGVDRALDAIRHGQFTGASSNGGVLLLAGDDPECKSSTLPSASEHTLISVDAPVLYPGTVEDILTLGLHGIAMSRRSGLWVAMKIVAQVADGTATVDVGRAVRSVVVADSPDDTEPVVRTPSLPESMDAERDIASVRLGAAQRYGLQAGLVRVTIDSPHAWFGVAAAGPLYGEVIEAFRRLGFDEAKLARYGVRLLDVKLLHPIDPEAVVQFSDGLDEVLVVEEKRPLLEPLIRSVLYGRQAGPVIIGRFDESNQPLLAGHGGIHATELAAVLQSRLKRRVPDEEMRSQGTPRQSISVTGESRTPYFCSGCPHNTSTRVPQGSLVGGGIGCHAIVRWAEPTQVGEVVTKAQMGGEGGTWLGIAPFVADDHLFQNLGDGTYFHSGQLAIQAAVAAKSHITFKLLFNQTIAMTGGQDIAERNGRPVSEVAAALLSQGVARVLVTTEDVERYKAVDLPRGVEVWPRTRIIEAQELLRATPGVTVLIHDQECATERRRKRKRGIEPAADVTVSINERVCEGCGDCGSKSNCLSIERVDTEFGVKRKIDQTSCNQDYTCLEGNCPSFVTLRTRRSSRRSRQRPTVGSAPHLYHGAGKSATELPEPSPIVAVDDFAVRMPGVGGTGVVTVSQIIGQAASLEGKSVRGLDQTGLSQKAGPVVSDVRITSQPQAGSNRAGHASVDLLLCFDELVALAPEILETAEKGRTVVVCATSPTQTGRMVTDPGKSLPSELSAAAALTDALGGERVFFVDARQLSTELYGSGIYANVLLLGAAFQLGAIPVRAESLERAIAMNGVAVDANTDAFRAGRRSVFAAKDAQPRVSSETLRSTVKTSRVLFPNAILAHATLGPIVNLRAEDLVSYQDRRYAQRYIDMVVRVFEAEQRISPGAYRLSEAVARFGYQLMAYKDEYEVARLHLEALCGEGYGEDVHVSWMLEPPILKMFGVKHKITVGPWFRHVFQALKAGRRLRGTPFDPFATTVVRRAERDLVHRYEEDLKTIAAGLSSESYDDSCRLAELPGTIRGYEEVKMRSIEAYRVHHDALMQSFRQSTEVGV